LKAQQGYSAASNDLIGLSAIEHLLCAVAVAHDHYVEGDADMIDLAADI
jgi:hypothetical protein